MSGTTDICTAPAEGANGQVPARWLVSVIICAYTERRWHHLVEAVESVLAQHRPADEILLVVDHNPHLLVRARAAFTGVRILQNEEAPGLAAARNAGVRHSRGDIVAFLDDDAVARPEWLGALLSAFHEPEAIAAGGSVQPAWAGAPPRWLPVEFLWVVGATYEGLPRSRSRVRNPIGANMAFRREAFERAGCFSDGIGRVRDTPLGCEETEFAIRVRRAVPGSVVLYVPEATVDHHVEAERTTWRYFVSRCWAEGVSKALVAARVGSGHALSSERSYVAKTLPSGIRAGLVAAARGEPHGLLRSGAIVAGLAVTAAAYLRARHSPALAGTEQHSFRPKVVRSVELTDPLPDIEAAVSPEGAPYAEVLLLARLDGEPLGVTLIPLRNGRLDAKELADQLWSSLGERIRARVGSGLPEADRSLGPKVLLQGIEGLRSRQPEPVPAARAPHVTVVVPTGGRSEQLRRCLRSLRALRYPRFDILVVDNRPGDLSTRSVVEEQAGYDERVRYAAEPLPGSSVARNHGLVRTAADIVAFTDDDVIVDADWLDWLVKPIILDPDVGAVTGLVLPAELETPAQWWFEAYGGFSKGFERRTYDLNGHRADDRLLYPYWGGMFGSGNSMAFRRSSLHAMGGFDPALGAGSPARAGSDIEAFTRVILRGERLVYEPRSICWHEHRRDERALRRQLLSYGVGFTAILTKCCLRHPSLLLGILRLLPAALKGTRANPSHENLELPRRLTRLERRGYLLGPLLYARSVAWARRLRLGEVITGRT